MLIPTFISASGDVSKNNVSHKHGPQLAVDGHRVLFIDFDS